MKSRVPMLWVTFLLAMPVMARAEVVSLHCIPDPDTYRGDARQKPGFTSERLWIDSAKSEAYLLRDALTPEVNPEQGQTLVGPVQASVMAGQIQIMFNAYEVIYIDRMTGRMAYHDEPPGPGNHSIAIEYNCVKSGMKMPQGKF